MNHSRISGLSQDPEYRIEKKIRDNDTLRRSFNELAMQTWELDFEAWYRKGYWTDRYIPYCIVQEGRVVANVSVNLMHFAGEGKEYRFIQLGTVMTDPAYRSRGLSRRLMEEIDRDWAQWADAFYLFANDTVLDFYPRFGYRKAEEADYILHIDGSGSLAAPLRDAGADIPAASSAGRPDAAAVRVPMQTAADRAVLERAVRRSCVCGRFDMRDNAELVLFTVPSFMQENVYYIAAYDAYVIAEQEEDTLCLHHIFSPAPLDPREAAGAFGGQIRRLTLGFTPADRSGYTHGIVQEEDTTLFIRGEGLRDFEAMGVRFPSLSHA